MGDGVDVARVADELYGLVPGEFTAARDARVAELKKAGDVDAAGAVKELRKPTTAAWVLNLLARRRADDIGRLVEIGDELRAAQDELNGDDLRRLSQERGTAVADIARQAGALARDAGHPVSDAVLDDVATSLDAAVADPDTARLLRAGCMTTPPARAGFEFDVGPDRPRRPPEREAQTRGRARDASRPTQRAQDAAAAESVERLARATRAHEEAVRERRSADQELRAVNRRIAAAERKVQSLRADHARATERLREARRREEGARKDLARASVEAG